MGSVRRRSSPRGVALACALLLAAACQPGTPGDEPEEVTQAPPAATEGQGDDPDGQSVESQDAEGDEAPRGTGGADLREPLALDIQQTHPNGTVVRILEARFVSNAVELGVEILNPGSESIQLHVHEYEPEQMVLVDDVGNRYPLSPPPDNRDLRVEGGERLQGTLTFLGRIDPAATELTLHTYGGYDGRHGDQDPHAFSVNMSIGIPLEEG